MKRTADFAPLSFLGTLHLDPTSQRAAGIKRGRDLAHRFALQAIGSQKESVSLSPAECADVLRFLGKATARNSGGWTHDDVHGNGDGTKQTTTFEP